MKKFAFSCAMLFSFQAYSQVQSCAVGSLDQLYQEMKEQLKGEYLNTEKQQLAEAGYQFATRIPRPEVGISVDVEKEETKNNEIELELSFNLNDYWKRGEQKKSSALQRDITLNEAELELNEKARELVVSTLDYHKGQFFLAKLAELLKAIEASEKVYSSKQIKSLEDEMILVSTDMLKTNIRLKMAKISGESLGQQKLLRLFPSLACQLDYEKVIGQMQVLGSFSGNAESRELKQLLLKENLLVSDAKLQAPLFLENLKFGPRLTRESLEGKNEYKIGVSLSFDFPGGKSGYSDIAALTEKISAKHAGLSRSLVEIEKSNQEKELALLESQLKKSPSYQKMKSDLDRVKHAFDRGQVSMMVYIDSYRNFIDYLESVEEMRGMLIERYLVYKGNYDENK